MAATPEGPHSLQIVWGPAAVQAAHAEGVAVCAVEPFSQGARGAAAQDRN